MKIIARIARVELRLLFYTPMAWVALLIFAAMAGIGYADFLDVQFDFLKANRETRGLTNNLFANGVFEDVKNLLFLFIPVITMGLFSREKTSGTIRLLYSSPINIWKVVVGKYLAVLIYSLLFVMVILAILYSSNKIILFIDLNRVFSGLVMMYLLVMAYSAVGLFMSTLTNYQVVSAICAMSYIKGMDLLYDASEGHSVMEPVINWLSITHHSDQGFSGGLRSDNIAYYVLFSVFFVVLCITKLATEGQEKKEKKKTWVMAMGSGVVLFFVFRLFSTPSLMWYGDFTYSETYSIRPESQQEIALIDRDEPLEHTIYINIMEYNSDWFSARDIEKGLEKYQKHLPNLTFNHVFYFDSTYVIPERTRFSDRFKSFPFAKQAEFMAVKNGVNPSMLVDIADHPDKEKITSCGRNVRAVTYKGKTLYMCTDIGAGFRERNLIVLLKQLVVPKINIAFLDGNGERSLEDDFTDEWSGLKELRHTFSLPNNGFNVSLLDLNNEDIPDDVEILVMGDPKTPYSEEVMGKIEKYIADGKNMVVTGEPGRQDILNPFLETLGLRLMDGSLQESEMRTRSRLGPVPNISHYPFGPESERVIFPGLKFFGITGIEQTGKSDFDVLPLLQISGSAKVGKSVTDSRLKRSLDIGVLLEREISGKKQVISVFSDSDFLSNEFAKLRSSRTETENTRFFFDMLSSHYTKGRFPFFISNSPRALDEILHLTNTRYDRIKFFFVWLIPGLIGLFGGVVIFIRRRK